MERDSQIRRRAYGAVRSLILGVSSFAIVGVLFAVYQYSTGVGDHGEVPDMVEADPGLLEPVVNIDGDESPGLTAGAARLGHGKSIKLIQYEPNTTRARFELEVADYKPIGSAHDDVQKIELVRPVIRLATREGQRVRVEAAGGFLDVKKRGEGAFEPRGGELIGRVDIKIDRLSTEERELLSPDQRDAPADESRLVTLTFDGVKFDLDASSVSTQGPFTVKMAEARIEGVGLQVRYNDVDNRVEHFEIMHGGSAVVFGGENLFGSIGEVPRPPHTPALGSEETAVADGGSGPGQSGAADEPFQTYVAEIDDAVKIRRFDGEGLAQELSTDRLNVLFDFSRRQREAIRAGSSPDATGTASREGDPIASTVGTGGRGRTTMEWRGGFVVRPGVIADSDSRLVRGARLRVVAMGDEVRITGRQGEAVCGMFEFHRETGKLWLTSGADGWVSLSGDRSKMVSGDVFVDRSAGILRIDGPARLSGMADGSGMLAGSAKGQSALSEVDIRFEDSAELTIASQGSEVVEPSDAGVESVSAEYIASARFEGDVMLRRGGDVLAGDMVEMTFDPPSDGGFLSDQIRELNAGGQVLLVRGQDRLTCADLSVELAPDPTGRALPRNAQAEGDVAFNSGELMVTAGGAIELDLVPVLKPKKEFNLWDESLDAIARGVDPTSVDWDKVRAEREALVEYETGLERMTASGGVTAYDPTRRLDVTAESFEGKCVNGRDVEQIRVTGPDGSDAFVQFGDVSIASHAISANLQTRRVDVFGPGKLRFDSYRGLAGDRTADLQENEISWKKEMVFRGRDRTGHFLGDVHATSRRRIRSSSASASDTDASGVTTSIETATFDCGELAIDFIDVEPEPSRDAVLAERWWIFAPVAKLLSPKEKGSTGPKLGQEPSYVVASRDVVGVFKSVDAVTGRVKSRVRLAADKLTADLQSNVLTVPVAGTLLIEDYKEPSTGGVTSTSDEALFNRGMGNVPSQTFASWKELMSFDASRYRAVFQKDVVLDYRSGDEMLLADTIIANASFVPGRGAAGGRHTRLECATLTAEFERKDGTGTGTEGAVAGMSLRGIRQLEARGGVFLEDEEFSVIADRVAKYENSDLLRIFGRAGEEAEIYSRAAQGPRFRGMEFSYDLTAGRIDAPNLQIRGRR